jgi:hypothetical protein
MKNKKGATRYVTWHVRQKGISTFGLIWGKEGFRKYAAMVKRQGDKLEFVPPSKMPSTLYPSDKEFR